MYEKMGKARSTLVMDEDLWKRFRMIAILNDMEISELVEQALREKLERMKQLEQYDSYKEVEKIHIPKTQQQQQSQSIKPQQKPGIIHEEDSTLAHAKKNEKIYLLWLPELEFPISEKNLTEFALNTLGDGDRLLSFIQGLPKVNKTYRNKEELEEDLRKAIHKYVVKIKPSKKDMIVECVISTDKDLDAAESYFIDEKSKRMRMLKTT